MKDFRLPISWNRTWGIWFFSSASSFIVLEYLSLQTGDPTSPFSHQLRRAFGLKPRARARGLLLGLAVGAGQAWLCRHLLQIPEDPTDEVAP